MNTPLLLLGLGIIGLTGCHRSEPAAAAKDAPAEKAAPKETEGLKLTKEAREISGIKLIAVEAAKLVPGLTAFGRVLDPGPLIQQISDLATARAASDASARDLERTRKLNTLGENASARTLESAEATARRDALATDLAAQKITATWGPVLAGREDLPAFVQRLVRQEAALLRLDLPAGEVLAQPPAEISVSFPANAKLSWPAEFVSFAASADPQTQTQGLLAIIAKNPPPIGLNVVSKISLGGEAKTGVRVPRSAVVRYGDGSFVFAQKEPDTFARQAIEIEGEIDGDWFVSEGLTAGAQIVSEGAQQLLSEELKGSSPAAD
jgi:hypothetical protein